MLLLDMILLYETNTESTVCMRKTYLSYEWEKLNTLNKAESPKYEVCWMHIIA